MRFVTVFPALVIGSFALLSLSQEQAQGCDRRPYGGAVYYQPMPIYYYQPYYAPPVYYQPRVPYAPPRYNQPSYGPAYSPAQPTTTINIGASDDYFEPGMVKVQPGTTVKWVNKGQHTHTVTSKEARWDSGDLPPGAVYSVTFETPGTYSYYCRHHKGMLGTIVVGGSSTGGNSGASVY